MKKAVCKSMIWAMMCVCVLGGCGKEGEPQQEMQSSDKEVSLDNVKIPENRNGDAESEGAGTAGNGNAGTGAEAAGNRNAGTDTDAAENGDTRTGAGVAENGDTGTAGNGSIGTAGNGNAGTGTDAAESGNAEARTDVAETGSAGAADSAQSEIRTACKTTLERLCTEHILPNGTPYENPDDNMNHMWANKFAIYDIDLDGKDELILQITETFMAGMEETVYNYDSVSGEFKVEFSEFPSLTFYDNGIVRADMSHNHGISGDFWPYAVYKYDKRTDSYGEVGGADAWDSKIAKKDYNGNSFPEDVDSDGDGIVYYVMGGEYKENTIVDLQEYNQWWESLVGDAKKIEIPYQNLTEENIAAVCGGTKGQISD